MIAWGLFCAWGFVYISWIFVSPAALTLFNQTHRSILHPLFVLGLTVAIAFLPQRKYAVTAKITAPVFFLLAGMFLLLPGQRVWLCFAMGPVMGLLVAPMMQAYVYLLNNSEKLYSLLLMYGLIGLLGLCHQSGLLHGQAESVLCAGLLLLSLLPIRYFDKNALPLRKRYEPPKP
ncbi:MAG: hypothetical protein FWH26_07735, partial [Oscillospiraceae bacterium]|nr:hypothetical protein [Oscillospiraceae bacterium]